MSQNWKTKNEVQRVIENEDYFILYLRFGVETCESILCLLPWSKGRVSKSYKNYTLILI